MEKGKSGKKIWISPGQYAELEALAKKHDLTVDQLAEGLLEKQIVYAAHRELFTPGLKWMAPKAAIIMARILRRDYRRLRSWLEAHDHIDICTLGEDGTLYLMNQPEITAAKLKEIVTED